MEAMNRSPLFTRAALFFLLFAGGVTIAYFMLKPDGKLPVYHPSQLDPRLVDSSVRNEAGEHHISDFHLIDQNGDSVSLHTVKGKILLADFFFTTCGSICPKMSAQLERVQEAFKTDDRVMLLSHSVTPEIDSVPRLKTYAEMQHADPRHWRFLTGDRPQIYRLARQSYFAATSKGDGGMNDFVHTENFVLVDPQLRIRGFYDGTSPEDVDRAMGDVRKLLEEQRE